MDARLANASAFMPFAALEVAYMLAGGYLPAGSLLADDNMARLAGLDVSIVHGRNDHVCVPYAAWRFANALRQVGVHPRLRFIEGAGHSDSEPPIAAALREETDRLRAIVTG